MNDTAKICRELSDSADMGKLALPRCIVLQRYGGHVRELS